MPIANVLPDFDVDVASWDAEPRRTAATTYQRVNDGTFIGGHVPNDNTYMYTSRVDGAECVFGFQAIAGASRITQVSLNIRAKIEDATAQSSIDVTLYYFDSLLVIGATQKVFGAAFGGYNVKGETTVTWSGLSLPKYTIFSVGFVLNPNID